MKQLPQFDLEIWTFSFAGVAALRFPRVRESRVLTLIRRGAGVNKSLQLLARFGVLLFGLSPSPGPSRADGGLVVSVDEDPGPRVPHLASTTVSHEVSSLLVSHHVLIF